ncbi:dihydrolipoyl dehydrogenase family protein [Salinicoccus albus]|uniref:dihydrolipoyl dehydrogenase family protein n=1 Tax=Salinicoccus albus TaxID=418756 RepID=UPI00036FD593|nr:NAD(P)/FAD-dependent oxidoreductase [Salinicoccus albus]
MMKEYNLVVIGSGTAGSIAAAKCKKSGWSVAMIDERPFGGTCALRGCDPKKVLVGITEYMDGVERLKGSGINGDIHINWNNLMNYKKTFTDDFPEMKEKGLKKQGIDTYHGHAAFIDENKIKVNEETLKGNYFLIAAGASPAKLPIEGSEHFTFSDDFLELEELPKDIVFVGGGYISFEFAHIATRAGANVHIIHRGERPLEDFDKDLVDQLVNYSKDIGIQIHLSTEVKKVEKMSNHFIVTGSNGSDKKEFSADLVVHGASRAPNTDSLNLKSANVNVSKKGIEVNDYLQSTSNSRVYAAGDVSDSPGMPLTPVAGMESHLVASNLLNGNNRTYTEQIIPSSVFTLPKLATVGMSEEDAAEKGLDFKVNAIDTTKWFTYKRTNQAVAFVKILIDEENDQIIGAHLLSHEADELINIFATAIQFELSTKDLKKMMFAYPTAASDIGYML